MSKKVISQRRKVSNFWFVWNLLEAIVLLAGGVLAIVAGIMYNQNSGTSMTIENVVAYVVGAFIILDGILRVVLFLARFKEGDEQSPMVIAGFEIALGILLVLMQVKFTEVHIFTYTVVNLIAIVLMVMGALLLVYAIYFIARKLAKLFMPIVEILFAAILIGVGVVIEVLYNSQDTRDQLVLILTGSILCVISLGMFIIAVVTHNKTKKELDLAEEEEEGDYRVRKDIVGESVVDDEPKPADIVDVQEVYREEPEKLSGPRAISRKDK